MSDRDTVASEGWDGYEAKRARQQEWADHMKKVDKETADMLARQALGGRREQPQEPQQEQPDLVNHPPHYRNHPSGVECIQITEHMNFCLGNAMKYIWRCGLKGDEVEDLKKARWYIDRELKRRMFVQRTTKIEGGQ